MKRYQIGCSYCKHTITSDTRDQAITKMDAHEQKAHPIQSAEYAHVVLVCSHDQCDEFVKEHYWAKVHAGAAGWFFQKNGDSWCPDHNPPWVSEWRNKDSKKVIIS